jgi:predicted PurR-regulated permease PerM
MKASFGSSPVVRRQERGAASLRMIIVLLVVAIIGYVCFQYIPVAYQARSFRNFMNEKVTAAAENPSIPTEQKGSTVEKQLRESSKDYGVPPDAKISYIYQNGGLQVTVQYTRQINLLPGFTHQYKFDYTAKSDTSLNAP